ncbi:MAG: hypothetical protein IPF66_06525 [Holophagales bacterium]|nr:hypothetical protein [Holophagales bacterium]
MATEAELFDALEALAASRPFRVDDVSRKTGLALAPDKDGTDEIFAVHRGRNPAGPLFVEAELRTPGPGATAPDGILILTLNRAVEVTVRSTTSRFGSEQDLIVPTPDNPPILPPTPSIAGRGVTSGSDSSVAAAGSGQVVLDATGR